MSTVRKFGNGTLSQSVTEDLLRQIRQGVFPVGSQLPTQQELTKKYGVGHSVVRDAMQQLATMGIVDVRPRRGAVVLSVDSTRALDEGLLAVLLDDQAIDEIFSLRRLISVEMAGQAAEKGTDDQLRAIGRAHEKFVWARANKLPLREFDIDFHRMIAEACGSGVYLHIFETLSRVMSAIRPLSIDVEGSDASTEAEHAAIADAIVKRDAGGAREMMGRHLDTATAISREAATSRK